MEGGILSGMAMGAALDKDHSENSSKFAKAQRIFEQIHCLRSLQEEVKNLKAVVLEKGEKLQIHEHYMKITSLLTSRNQIEGLSCHQSYQDRIIEKIVNELEDSIAEKQDGQIKEDTCKN